MCFVASVFSRNWNNPYGILNAPTEKFLFGPGWSNMVTNGGDSTLSISAKTDTFKRS